MSAEEFEQRRTDYEVAHNNRVQAEYDAKAVVAAIENRLVSLKICHAQVGTCLHSCSAAVRARTDAQGGPVRRGGSQGRRRRKC